MASPLVDEESMMPAVASMVSAKVLTGFDDPALGPGVWSRLLEGGETNAVNLTWHWQASWWNAFAPGQLLLVAASRGSELVAIAPLFASSGMIFNICPEDHLDFVGDISDPMVLDAMLTTARDRVE